MSDIWEFCVLSVTQWLQFFHKSKTVLKKRKKSPQLQIAGSQQERRVESAAERNSHDGPSAPFWGILKVLLCPNSLFLENLCSTLFNLPADSGLQLRPA